jgi:hypothetical protein
MSEVTRSDKVVRQARVITALNSQINFLLCELYTIKPDHKMFIDSPSLGEQVKKLSELVKKQVSKSNNDATQFAKENPSTDPNVERYNHFHEKENQNNTTTLSFPKKVSSL